MKLCWHFRILIILILKIFPWIQLATLLRHVYQRQWNGWISLMRHGLAFQYFKYRYGINTRYIFQWLPLDSRPSMEPHSWKHWESWKGQLDFWSFCLFLLWQNVLPCQHTENHRYLFHIIQNVKKTTVFNKYNGT